MPSASLPAPLRPSSPRVVIHGRAGCHLCTEAEAVVAQVCTLLGETWEKVSIDDDPALLERYGELIPVVWVDGVEIACYRVDAATLRAALGGHLPHGS